MNTNINSNQNNQNQSNQNVDPLAVIRQNQATLRDYMMPQLAELRCVLQCAISSFKEGIEIQIKNYKKQKLKKYDFK